MPAHPQAVTLGIEVGGLGKAFDSLEIMFVSDCGRRGSETIPNLDFSGFLPAVSLLCGHRGPSGRPLCRVRLSLVASTVLSVSAQAPGVAVRASMPADRGVGDGIR